MIFKSPWMLFLLLFLPLLGKLLARSQRLKNQSAASLRGEKIFSNSWKKRRVFQLGSFTALIFALAQPSWNPRPVPLNTQERDLVIGLDISRSMLAADVFPNRLNAARMALYECLKELRGQRIGLITFAGSASVRVPLTLDHHFVRYMLERAVPSSAAVGSTSLQAAIEKAIDIVLRESEKGKQDLIIFTDGEDHISDIEKTTEELRECETHVLIIGLGDSENGAKIPGIEKTNEWMQYKGQDVTTRLDEATLKQLSSKSPNVTYYPARTRPFDLISRYRQMVADTPTRSVSDETQRVYTQGYPFLIALALILWITPFLKRIFPSLAILFVVSCASESNLDFAEKIKQGQERWLKAQDTVESDPRVTLPILFDAREKFLCAALIQPGDEQTAQQIAGVSAQIHEVERKLAALSPEPNRHEGQDSTENSEFPDENEMDLEEDMEWSESKEVSEQSMPISSKESRTALENRSLPTPNYTAEDILKEEAENMKKRTQQQANRAGSKVDKNW